MMVIVLLLLYVMLHVCQLYAVSYCVLYVASYSCGYMVFLERLCQLLYGRLNHQLINQLIWHMNLEHVAT